MIPEFNTAGYFLDVLALCVLLVPAFALLPSALARRLLLIGAGAYLLYLIAPRLLLFQVAFWALVWGAHRLVVRTAEGRGAVVFLWTCLLLTLAPMVLWKLWTDAFHVAFNLWGNASLQPLSERLWQVDLARNIIIPIGLSFSTFRGVDLLVKSYLGTLPRLSVDRVLFYGLFPTVLVIGPIIEYEEIQNGGDAPRNPSAVDLYAGVVRIALGLLKVLVLGDLLKSSGSVFLSHPELSLPGIWLSLFAFVWFFYLNFSGYSDLAIGVSRLFGFQLKENFSFPYFRRNIAEFWQSWHMSLSRFAQRNAFVPLGGYRARTQFVAVFVTMMVIALWHDLSLGMLLFGTYHGIGLIVHRLVQRRFGAPTYADGSPRAWLAVATTFLFVAFSFPLLIVPLGQAARFYLAVVGLG